MPSSILKALNELPITLDETYERALEGIPKEKRQHAHRLFQCLVVAIRPLRVEELAELFAIEFDQDAGHNLKEGWRPENAEDAVLSACSTLIAVIQQGIEICSILSLLGQGVLDVGSPSDLRDRKYPALPHSP